ncbi:SAM-dependent methyltransferase [Streptomyces europaeiscabiei]|uniref:SAM-dependent methyltransferase n=1 Tax=Streptomyces europaeiscabiei TaxID=146819 RepID=UPI002E18088C
MRDGLEKYAVGVRLADRHGALEGRPGGFDLLDMRWDLLPGVFSPLHTASTELFTRWVPYPVGGRFLEVGSGTGVTAVTAVDITEAAVRNTRMNAARHGVTERVRTLRSDLFDALEPGDRFDLIFWNSNVVEAPGDFECTREIELAIFDSGYVTHERFLRQGFERLADGGRLLLGFNSLGNLHALHSIAEGLGLRIQPLVSAKRQAGSFEVEFQLLELAPCVDGAA